MGRVTETSENTLENHDPVPARYEHRPNRLYRALAWVGIAAGSLFIVATVFFSGYVLGQHGGAGMHHGPHRMMLKPFPGPGPDDRPRAERLTPPSAPPSTPPRP
jgi:hypothetical protein